MPDDLKSCFVIAPIGEPGSDPRIRSDKVLRHVIKPAARECGYDARRADELDLPGMIDTRVLQRVVDADLVIANLTDGNANVFYELALRHAHGLPSIQLIQANQRIPFDTRQLHTLVFDLNDWDSGEACRAQLVEHIRAVEANPNAIDNPISEALRLKGWKVSNDSEAQRDAVLSEQIQGIGAQLAEVQRALRLLSTPPLAPPAYEPRGDWDPSGIRVLHTIGGGSVVLDSSGLVRSVDRKAATAYAERLLDSDERPPRSTKNVPEV